MWTRRNHPFRLELRAAVSAAGLQGDRVDRQLGTLRESVGGHDVEAEAQRVWFYAYRYPDLKGDASDCMHALLAGAFDDEVDDALGQRQFVHFYLLAIASAGPAVHLQRVCEQVLRGCCA